MRSDVLIVGGGVIGLSIARDLHKKGAGRITVVEKGSCGQEASWAAAGMLGPQAEADGVDPFFALCSASRDMYTAFAAELLEETGIDIELDRTGTIALAFDDADGELLNKRARWQREAGLPVETLFGDDLAKLEPYIAADAHFGLLFENDWQVENRKLVAALRRYAEINEIELVENTSVNSLSLESGRVIGADTSRGRVSAGMTVAATGAWTSFIKLGDAALPLSVVPVRGQIIVLRPAERVFAHVMHTPRGYIVPRSDGRFLVGSTSEQVGFDKGTTRDAADTLLAAACEMSPFFKGVDIADHWSGLRPYTSDGLPVIGAIDGIAGLVVATAHYRNGILLAPITAKLIADALIDGKRSPYFEDFGAARFSSRVSGRGI